MEKYLRLLNPKTTNYDAIGGGNFGALTREDVLIAIGYARLSDTQDILVKCVMGHFGIDGLSRISDSLIAKYRMNKQQVQCPSDNERLAFKVALLELFVCPANYKATYRNRAALAGKSHMYVKRTLDSLINAFKDQIENDLKDATRRIEYQIDK